MNWMAASTTSSTSSSRPMASPSFPRSLELLEHALLVDARPRLGHERRDLGRDDARDPLGVGGRAVGLGPEPQRADPQRARAVAHLHAPPRAVVLRLDVLMRVAPRERLPHGQALSARPDARVADRPPRPHPGLVRGRAGPVEQVDQVGQLPRADRRHERVVVVRRGARGPLQRDRHDVLCRAGVGRVRRVGGSAAQARSARSPWRDSDGERVDDLPRRHRGEVDVGDGVVSHVDAVPARDAPRVRLVRLSRPVHQPAAARGEDRLVVDLVDVDFACVGLVKGVSACHAPDGAREALVLGPVGDEAVADGELHLGSTTWMPSLNPSAPAAAGLGAGFSNTTISIRSWLTKLRVVETSASRNASRPARVYARFGVVIRKSRSMMTGPVGVCRSTIATGRPRSTASTYALANASAAAGMQKDPAKGWPPIDVCVARMSVRGTGSVGNTGVRGVSGVRGVRAGGRTRWADRTAASCIVVCVCVCGHLDRRPPDFIAPTPRSTSRKCTRLI